MPLIELSHVIDDGMTTYPGLPAPTVRSHMSYQESHDHYADGTEFYIGRVELVGNTGTYLDAPIHRHRGGLDVASLPLERCADLPGIVIRGDSRTIGPDAISQRDVAGGAVLFHTGHADNWGSDDYFSDYPFILEETAEALVAEGVSLVGIDSLNVDDTAGSGERPVHTVLLSAGIPIVEHLTDLERLPDSGFAFTAAPPPITGMASMPVRAYANVPG